MSYPPPYGYPAQGADPTQAGYGYAADPYAAYYYNQAYAADPNAAAYYNQYYAQYGAQVPQATEEGEGATNADETSEGKRKAERSKKLDVHGNQETMNLAENVLVPVQSSDYFKSLYQYKTYHEVLQEIKNKVNNMETFIPNTRYASHAMCLMYKLFRMRITVKQMNGLLANKDNPYVRAVGFLYLRLCAPPTQLWDFFKDYLLDTEVLTLGVRGSRPSTIGKMVRELLTEPKFFDIFLPRFTVSQNKEFAQKLKEFDAANPSTAAKEEGEVERKRDRDNKRSRSKSRERKRSRSRERRRSRSRDRDSRRDNRDRDRDNRRDRHSRSRSRDRRRSRSRDRDNRRRSRSRSRDRKRPREDDRDDRDSKRARNEESSSSTQKKSANPAARAAIMSMYGASTEIKEDVNKKVGAWASDEEKFTLGSKRN